MDTSFIIPFLYFTVIGFVVAGFFITAIITLSYFLGGQWWRLLAFCLLLIVGTIPPTTLGVFWYAKASDYIWAIQGPGVFAYLGSGPSMLAIIILISVWVILCWLIAFMQVKHIISQIAKQHA